MCVCVCVHSQREACHAIPLPGVDNTTHSLPLSLSLSLPLSLSLSLPLIIRRSNELLNREDHAGLEHANKRLDSFR